MIYFIIIFSIGYIILSWKRLDWAVGLLLAALPSYLIRFDVLGIPMTLLEAMILIAFLVWAVRNYRLLLGNIRKRLNRKSTIDNRKLLRYPFDWEIVLLLIISLGAVVIAGFSNSALGIWKAYFFEPVLVFILIFNVFKYNPNLRIDPNTTNANSPNNNAKNKGPDDGLQITNFQLQISKILWPLCVSALVVSVWAILQKLGLLYSPANFLPRVTGSYPYPNALGLYLGPLVMLMIGWFIQKLQIPNSKFQIPNKFKITNSKFKISQLVFIGTTIVLSLLAIFFAKSEGAMVGIAVAVLFFIGFVISRYVITRPGMFRLGIVKTFIIIGLAMAYPLIALNVYPPYYYPHFSNEALNYVLNKGMLKDISGEIRKQQWRETWQMMTASPLRFVFGTGLDNYESTVAPFHQPGIFYNFEHDPDFRRKIVLFGKSYKETHWQPVEIYMYPHSIVLNFWTELGIAGALLFIWIIGKYLWLAIANFKFLNKSQIPNSAGSDQYLVLGLLCAMIAMVIHGIVDVPYFKNDLSVMFWVLAAMVGMFDLRRKTKNISTRL